MLRRIVIASLAGLFLIGVPVLAYCAYDYAYNQTQLYKSYRFLSGLGLRLRLIAMVGVMLEVAAWAALARYVWKSRKPILGS